MIKRVSFIQRYSKADYREFSSAALFEFSNTWTVYLQHLR